MEKGGFPPKKAEPEGDFDPGTMRRSLCLMEDPGFGIHKLVLKSFLENLSFAVIAIAAFLILTGCGEPISDPTPPEVTPAKSEPKPSKKQGTVPKSKKAGPVENIDSSERLAAARLMEARDPVAHEIKIFDAEIRGAFDEKKFEILEETGRALRESGELFPDGSWKIFRFYEAIDNRFHTGDDGFLTDLETHREWEEKYPNSVTRQVALADMLVSYAWRARGSGYAHTVTEEGWRLMKERLNQAAAALKAARDSEERDPYWYTAAMTVGTGQSWDAGSFDRVLKEAREEFPGYWHIETQRGYTLLPRWYGEEGDWQKFALEAAAVPDGLGDEAYARIVIRLSRYYPDVFRDAKADWPKMRAGLESLLKKYPESVSLRNWAAYSATLGRDREMASAHFESLGDEYVKSVWKKPERFVHFRTWAQTGKW